MRGSCSTTSANSSAGTFASDAGDDANPASNSARPGASACAIERQRERPRDRRHGEQLRLAAEQPRDGRYRIGTIATQDSCNGTHDGGAAVARSDPQRRVGGFDCRRGIAGGEQRLRQRQARREVVGVACRRVAPCGNGGGKLAKLPEHFAQVEARIGSVPIRAHRLAKAQHGVDRTAMRLVVAAAREPLAIAERGHQAGLRRKASRMAAGSTR